MAVSKSKKKVVIRSAIFLGGVIVCVIGLYCWAILRPTGFEPYRKKYIEMKENQVVWESEVQKRYSPPIKHPKDWKVQPTDPWLGTVGKLGTFSDPIFGDAMLSQSGVYVSTINSGGEKPSDPFASVGPFSVEKDFLIQGVQAQITSSPYGIVQSMFPATLNMVGKYNEPEYRESLELFEEVFFKEKPRLGVMDRLSGFIYNRLYFDDYAAYCIYRAGVQGDQEKFHQYLVDLTDVSLAIHRMSFGDASAFELRQLTGMIILFDEAGFLKQETVLELQKTIQEARFQQSELEDYIYQSNMRYIERVRIPGHGHMGKSNAFRYMLDGKLVIAAHHVVFPIYSKKVDEYGALWMEGEFDRIPSLKNEIEDIAYYMNYQEGDFNRRIKLPKYHPKITRNMEAIWAEANSDIWALEYILAAIRYKNEKGSWPSTDEDLLDSYMESPFPEEKRCGFAVIKVPEVEYHVLVPVQDSNQLEAVTKTFTKRPVFFTLHHLEDPIDESIPRDQYTEWRNKMWNEQKEACVIRAYFSTLPEKKEYLDRVEFLQPDQETEESKP